MIVGNIKEAGKYYEMHERIQAALEYLEYFKKSDLLNLENGKYKIEGDEIFAIVQDYETKPMSDGKWEAHKEYVDIQFIVEGKEQIGSGEIGKFSPASEYDIEKDIIFLDGEGEFSELSSGDFAIITPEFAHMPSISIDDKPEYVKKIVIKVKYWK